MLGNLKDGIIRKSSYSTTGSGNAVCNVKDDIIRESSYTSKGSGNAIGNVKDGYVYKSTYTSKGSGTKIGKVKDFTIPGMEREHDAEIVAAYHFLVKKIF